MSSGTTDHRPSVLIVDDDEIFRSRLGRSFERRDFDVRLAANADEAMSSALDDSPEFAVLDLRMPDVSGLELLRDLLRLDETTRAVMLTGYGSIATAIEAIRLGATNYVSKPADAADIIAAFEKGEKEPLEATDTSYKAPTLARAEWEHINRVLADTGGNISEAARRLGIHRRSLQRKLQRYPPNE